MRRSSHQVPKILNLLIYVIKNVKVYSWVGFSYIRLGTRILKTYFRYPYIRTGYSHSNIQILYPDFFKNNLQMYQVWYPIFFASWVPTLDFSIFSQKILIHILVLFKCSQASLVIKHQHGLPLNYWILNSLSRIASIVGKHVCAN